MQYGNIHEDHIRDELRELENAKTGWQIKGAGMRITLWGVRGRVDLLVRENLVWKLLEVKTMNPEDFRKFQTEGLTAFPRYYEQFMFYLEACRIMPFREEDRITAGILLAENTFPLGELCAEELTLDLQCVEDMQSNTESLQETIGLPAPPDRPFSHDSARCKHCFRGAECWEVKQDSKYIVATELPEPREAVRLVTEYLRHTHAKGDAEEALDKVKLKLRTLMDRNSVTEIAVPVGPSLNFSITLQQISVPEHTVKAYSFPRMDVR